MHPLDAEHGMNPLPDSSAFRRRAPRVPLSDDADVATAQTVREMCRQIHQAAADPLVAQCAVNAVQSFRGGPIWITLANPYSNPQCMAESCWFWCKHYLRFRHHGDMFEAWSGDLGDPHTKLQLLIAPDVLVRMKRMEGDCAIYTMMLAAMLTALGVRWEICTGAVDASQPEIFSHVWLRAVLPSAREPLDASHGAYPGWQVPAEDIHRLKVWDEGGNEVSHQRFSGLHAYRRTPARRGRRIGLGSTVCDDMGCYDDQTGEVVSSGTSANSGDSSYIQPGTGSTYYGSDYYTDSGTKYTGTTYKAPQKTDATNWASFATALAKSGMTLAQINAIQPGTVVSANGAILRQSTGYAVPGSSNSLSLSGGSSSSMLIIGGVVLLVGMMFLGRK